MLSLLFPPTCIACGVLLSGRRKQAPWGAVLCVRCVAAAGPLPAAWRCVDGIDAVLPYLPPWSTAVTRLKFSRQLALAGPLGALLATSTRLRTAADGQAWDGIVPVPLHVRRLLSRGFDQALLLARAAARHADGPPVWRRALRRVRPTPPQSRLPAAARAANLASAFEVTRRSRIAGRRVLLIDDVTTTGATLAACRAALLAAGAAHVGALALLRTVPG